MDYLTSANFLDMLDTGILICHLVRIIQDRAKVILSNHVHNEGTGTAVDPAPSSDVISDVKLAQQYLHALLRGANNNSTALAAAKVNSLLFHFTAFDTRYANYYANHFVSPE